MVGGGLLVWQRAAPPDGGGGTDGLSGVAGYQYRSSADGGGTWTAPQPGATAVVSAEGSTVVQFRTLDAAGNASAWAPAAPDASQHHPDRPHRPHRARRRRRLDSVAERPRPW